ncbi:MAG: IclR family transcriptional regulator [Thermomicrobiales bacterium]
MDGKTESIRSLTQSVERALSILTCFSDAQPRLRVADLVEQLGLSQSTVSRLLKTMESLGFVERDPQTGLYQLGLEMVTLAGVALNQVDLRGEAMGELSAVAAELGLAANLAILRRDGLFYIASVEGPMAPKRHTMIGKRGPLHSTGMGKVLLAHLPATEREPMLRRLPYPQFTPHTAGDADDLRPMLESVLSRGYATEREELAFGRACVAAPIRDATGAVVAATSISGPLRVLDLDRREAELAGRVVEMADRISQRLGYVGVSVSVLPKIRLQPVGGQ